MPPPDRAHTRRSFRTCRMLCCLPLSVSTGAGRRAWAHPVAEEQINTRNRAGGAQCVTPSVTARARQPTAVSNRQAAPGTRWFPFSVNSWRGVAAAERPPRVAGLDAMTRLSPSVSARGSDPPPSGPVDRRLISPPSLSPRSPRLRSVRACVQVCMCTCVQVCMCACVHV